MPTPTQNLPTRNKNPGDLKDPSTGAFRSFSTPDEGFNALKTDLHAKITGNTRTGLNANSTLMEFSKTWAPKGDGANNPVKYARDLAKQLGVRVSTQIGALASRLDDFAKAIGENEGFGAKTAYAAELPATSSKPRFTLAQLQAKYAKPQGSTTTPALPAAPNAKPRFTIDQLRQKYTKPSVPQFKDVPPPAVTAPPKKSFADLMTNQQKTTQAADEAGSPLGLAAETAKGVGEAITTSERALGETVGQIAGAGGAADSQNASVMATTALAQKTIRQIHQDEAAGKDTTRLKQSFNNLVKGLDPSTLKTILPVLQKTNLQVAGELGGTALDLLAAGTYGKAATGMETGALAAGEKPYPTAIQAVRKTASEPAGLLTKKGVGRIAAQSGVGYGYDVTQNAQQGKTGINVAKPGLGTVMGATVPAVAATAATLGNISDHILNAKTYIARKNVPEHLETSIDRLSQPHPSAEVTDITKPAANTPDKTSVNGSKASSPSAVPKKSPLDTYDEFYGQEQKFKQDIKEDTALGVVGSRIGKAYDRAIKMRRQAGQAMQSEMETVGHVKTNVGDSFPKLEVELKTNGLIYDAEKGKLIGERTSKVSGQDKSMLETYIGDLNTLGPNPTAAELDAFLSRVPNDLDVYKSKNNIVKATNGERIIKGHLRELRSALSPKSNKAFTKYDQAKSTYASLSGFLDEGASFLGKKTQTGDFAKDASLAKSSVQSILNQGKKDWLLKLEGLTGYRAIDESMLALQAMKDSGNFRGASLLDLLSPKEGGAVPTSAEGLFAHAIKTGVEAGREAFAGTPNEQTRRIIMRRMKEGQTSVPSQFLGSSAPMTQTDKVNRKSAAPQNGEKKNSTIDATTKKSSNIKGKIQEVIKNVKDTPNKQGGFTSVMGAKKLLAKKQPPYAALQDFEKYIDTVSETKGKVDPTFDANIRDLATKYGLDSTQSPAKLADDLAAVLNEADYHRMDKRTPLPNRDDNGKYALKK